MCITICVPANELFVFQVNSLYINNFSQFLKLERADHIVQDILWKTIEFSEAKTGSQKPVSEGYWSQFTNVKRIKVIFDW